MTPVAWVNYDPDAINRGYWDQGLLELLFKGEIWKPVGLDPDYTHFDSFEHLPNGVGAIVVLPARYHVQHIEKLNYQLDQLPWVLLILTSDEESLFPWREIEHDHMRMWIMTPRRGLHDEFTGRFIGEYFREDCPSILSRYRGMEKSKDWYFSGQVTHARRLECVEAARHLPNGDLNQTPGFTQGYQYEEYLRRMARAKIALAPSGPGTPDSFRLYEALEAGCVPIVDASSPGGPMGYWDMVFPDHPFDVLGHWNDLPDAVAATLDNWEERAAACSAWWQSHKRDLAYALIEDVKDARS